MAFPAVGSSRPSRVNNGLDTLSPSKRALLETALARRRESAGGDAIQRRREAGPAPLSFSQQRMWFLDQLAPGAPTHNAARAFRLRGSLDFAALHGALEALVERHPTLRTIVTLNNRNPRQVALESWTLPLPVVDMTDIPRSELEAQLASVLRAHSREPFDLAADLMFRTTLIRLAPQEHVLLIRVHHIAGDAASDGILFRELGVLYDAIRAGASAELEALPLEYADFAVWQHERLQGRRLEELVSYWTQHLADAPPVLRLPMSRPRPPVQRHVGARHDFTLTKDVADGVTELGRAHNATAFMVLLAAFVTLLYRVGGEDDVVVGTPIANRTHVELQQIVGFFSNTVALRIRLSGSPTFSEVVRRTREAAVGAYSHQDLPFEKVVESLQVPRTLGWNPVFQVNFRARTQAPPRLELSGLDVEPIVVDIGFSRFDLSLELQLAGDAPGGYFEYDVDLFDPAAIAGLIENLGALLEQVVADPDAEILALKLPVRSGSHRALSPDTPPRAIARRHIAGRRPR